MLRITQLFSALVKADSSYWNFTFLVKLMRMLNVLKKGYTVGLKFFSRKKEAMMTRTRNRVLL